MMKNSLLYKLLQWAYHFCINSFYSLKGLLIGNNKPFKIDGLLFNFPPSPLKDIGRRIQNYEYAGEERGFKSESTLLPVINKLLDLGFEFIDFESTSLRILMKNKLEKSI